VLRYLEERGIPFRTDSSNGDTAFLRNRLRLKLIPLLDEWFPHWRTGALHAAETQRLAADFLAARAREEMPWERVRGSPLSGLVLPEDEFFSRPEILREEALFQAIDRLALDPGRRIDAPDPPAGAGRADKEPPPPRRAALRLFSRRRLPALDLGGLRVERRDARVWVRKRQPPGEEGFSLLIKEPGLYTLEGFSVACTDHAPEREGFFAELPLVFRRTWSDDYGRDRSKVRRLRSSCTDLISALDRRGPAAFIGMKGGELEVVPCREKDDMIPSKAFFFYLAAGEPFSCGKSSRNTGGRDV
jgi:tRNA(Ile)-lysidine synthase